MYIPIYIYEYMYICMCMYVLAKEDEEFGVINSAAEAGCGWLAKMCTRLTRNAYETKQSTFCTQ